jgi:hypothetical protein
MNIPRATSPKVVCSVHSLGKGGVGERRRALEAQTSGLRAVRACGRERERKRERDSFESECDRILYWCSRVVIQRLLSLLISNGSLLANLEGILSIESG